MKPVGDILAELEIALAAAPEADGPGLYGHLETLQVRLLVKLMLPASPPAAIGPRYVTQTEAAALFGIPLADVRFLTRRGHVPVIGRGKNRRLLPADLERYLARCRAEGLAIRGIPEVSHARDREGSAGNPAAARDDATGVRRGVRRRAEHGGAVGEERADGGDDGRHPDPPPQ